MEIEEWHVLGLRSGDHKVFTEIYARFYPALTTYAQKKLDDENDADECVADAFIGLWNYRERITEPKHIKNFLYNAVDWKCANANRNYMVRISHLKKWQKGIDLNKLVVYQQHHGLWRPEIRRRLIQQLEQLPPSERKVLELYLLEGRTEKEIAQILNKSPNNVQATKIQALRKLKWDWIMILVFATSLCLRLFRWTLPLSIIGREFFRT